MPKKQNPEAVRPTPWFPGSTNPQRPGPYQRKKEEIAGQVVWSWWNGNYWGAHSLTQKHAADHARVRSIEQRLEWRGVVKEK